MNSFSLPSALLKNPKTRVILLIVALCLFSLYRGSTGLLPAVSQIILAVLTAVFAEFAIYGKIPATSLLSPVISGLIVGILIVPGTDMELVWAASAIAIASKKLFQTADARHIFNPAAFGLATVILLFGNKINWWGFSSPYLVITAGGFILYRMNRLSMVFSYILFRILSASMTGSYGIGLEIFQFPNLFFAFVMLIEPKTSPSIRTQQWVFGGLTGILSTVFFSLLPSTEGDLFALLTVNFLRTFHLHFFSQTSNKAL